MTSNNNNVTSDWLRNKKELQYLKEYMTEICLKKIYKLAKNTLPTIKKSTETD